MPQVYNYFAFFGAFGAVAFLTRGFFVGATSATGAASALGVSAVTTTGATSTRFGF